MSATVWLREKYCIKNGIFSRARFYFYGGLCLNKLSTDVGVGTQLVAQGSLPI